MSLLRTIVLLLATMQACATAPANECVPRVERGVRVERPSDGRALNHVGIDLVDWDGQVANPFVELVVVADGELEALVAADDPRIYFDLPSTAGASGPSKVVLLEAGVGELRVGIFPDRDGEDETHTLSIDVGGERTDVTIHVDDLDRRAPPVFTVHVDFSHDETGFFESARARELLSEAADDWAYFIADMALDPVPVGDEMSFIWDPIGSFLSGRIVTNTVAYTGFLMYATGIHGEQLRSGGAGSMAGKRQTSGGVELELLRSGTHEVETAGNYSTHGWYFAPPEADGDDWHHADNLLDAPTDFASITHHEIGHVLGRSIGWPRHTAAKQAGGLVSDALQAYLGGPLVIDPYDHFGGVVDPASGFGAFGNEYGGFMPVRRWLITKTDLLALEATGWKIRNLPVAPAERELLPECD